MLCYFVYIIWVDVHKLDIVVFTLPEQLQLNNSCDNQIDNGDLLDSSQ